MKLISQDKVFELIEGASDAHVDQAEKSLPLCVLGDMDLSPGWLAYKLKEGLLEAVTMELNAVPVATFYYKVDEQKTLFIEAAHSLDKTVDLDDCFEVAFRRLAASRGAARIKFVTRRPGAVKKAVRAGYSVCGVLLRRVITGADETDMRRPQKLQQNQGGSFGPSSSSASTTTSTSTQNATNQQVGVDNGIGLGAGATGNTINVTSDDLSVLQAAMGSNSVISAGAIQAGVIESGQAAASSTASSFASASAAAAASAAALESANASAASSASSSQSSAQSAEAAISGNSQVAGMALSTGLAALQTAAASNTEVANGAISGVVTAAGQADSLAASALALSNSTTANADMLAESAYQQFTTSLDDVATGSMASMSGLASQALTAAAASTAQTPSALLETLAGYEPGKNQSTDITGLAPGTSDTLQVLLVCAAIGVAIFAFTRK